MKISRKDKMKQGQAVAYYEALLSKRTDNCMELPELLEQLRVENQEKLKKVKEASHFMQLPS